MQPREGLVRLTHLIYGLHAFSAVMGVISSAAVVTAFLTGWPSIVAVILNYARRAAVRGTYLESHFRWQIRTFWYAVLWSIVIWAVSVPLMLILIGIPLFIAGHFALAIWIIYRVARGWTSLRDKRPMYAYP